MLIIRNEQREAFRLYMREKFERRMSAHLQSRFPEQTNDMTEQSMSDFIRSGITKAEGYQIVTEGDVQRFLEYMCTLGADFDINSETSWAAEILGNEHIDGSEKIDRIEEYIQSMDDHSI